jgi:predicted ArsR family transcriptional regulator
MNNLDPTRHRHGMDPESHAAWLAGVKPTLSQRRRAVLAAIAAHHERGLTCDELAVQWGVSPNQISGRFTELKARGLIGVFERRRTVHGCTAKAYLLTVAGQAALARAAG